MGRDGCRGREQRGQLWTQFSSCASKKVQTWAKRSTEGTAGGGWGDEEEGEGYMERQWQSEREPGRTEGRRLMYIHILLPSCGRLAPQAHPRSCLSVEAPEHPSRALPNRASLCSTTHGPCML
jgi:hypothetical protein